MRNESWICTIKNSTEIYPKMCVCVSTHALKINWSLCSYFWTFFSMMPRLETSLFILFNFCKVPDNLNLNSNNLGIRMPLTYVWVFMFYMPSLSNNWWCWLQEKYIWAFEPKWHLLSWIFPLSSFLSTVHHLLPLVLAMFRT